MKYALKALTVMAVELAGQGRALLIQGIVQQAGAPKRFLEHILLEIRNAGSIACDPQAQRRQSSGQGPLGRIDH